MKNTLFKKVLAVALACTMTFSMATVTHAADAKEITIGVTSFADTLEPTEQYFSWVVSRYAIGECLTKFDENGEIVPDQVQLPGVFVDYVVHCEEVRF